MVDSPIPAVVARARDLLDEAAAALDAATTCAVAAARIDGTQTSFAALLTADLRDIQADLSVLRIRLAAESVSL